MISLEELQKAAELLKTAKNLERLDHEKLVLVFREKPRPMIYVRAYPETARNPTPAQIACRLAFAEAARKAKGIKYAGLFVDLPPAAKAVAEALKGRSFGGRRKKPKWLKLLELWLSSSS